MVEFIDQQHVKEIFIEVCQKLKARKTTPHGNYPLPGHFSDVVDNFLFHTILEQISASNVQMRSQTHMDRIPHEQKGKILPMNIQSSKKT
jgi:hypothetical protein